MSEAQNSEPEGIPGSPDATILAEPPRPLDPLTLLDHRRIAAFFASRRAGTSTVHFARLGLALDDQRARADRSSIGARVATRVVVPEFVHQTCGRLAHSYRNERARRATTPVRVR